MNILILVLKSIGVLINHKTEEHVIYLSNELFKHDPNFTCSLLFMYLHGTLDKTGRSYSHFSYNISLCHNEGLIFLQRTDLSIYNYSWIIVEERIKIQQSSNSVVILYLC